jgi:hypothetical protein
VLQLYPLTARRLFCIADKISCSASEITKLPIPIYLPLADPTAAPATTQISLAESLRLHPSQGSNPNLKPRNLCGAFFYGTTKTMRGETLAPIIKVGILQR